MQERMNSSERTSKENRLTMEQFFGKKYALEWQDNFEEYLEFIGKNYIQRKTILALNQDVCLTKNDDGTYTYHFSTPFASSKTTFTPGIEFVETRADGVKVRALITIDDNKMIHEQMEENGRFSKHVRSFQQNSMTAITAFTTVYGADKSATKHYVLDGVWSF